MSKKSDNKIDIVVSDDINPVISASKTSIRSFDSFRNKVGNKNEIKAISGWAITDQQIFTEIVFKSPDVGTLQTGQTKNKINDNKSEESKDEKATQTATETVNESTETDKSIKSTNKLKKLFLESKNRKKRYIFLTALLITVPILITLIILLFLFAFVPCVFKRCHKNANVCVNHIFMAECICDYGYAGDGVKFCDECGVTYTQQNARIVGGSTAVAHSWPASVLIITNYKTDVIIGNKIILVEISFMCGGTLINRKSVLTAAHCIIKTFDYDYLGNRYEIKIQKNKYYPTEESMYRVFAGLQNRTALLYGDISPARSLEIDKITMHEEYDEENVLNDIAILRLKETVDLNKYIQIACLPNPKWGEFYPTNMPAWVLGWGTVKEGGPTPDTLKNVRINIYSNNLCDMVLPVRKNHVSQICAGDINGGRDTCDSGGSLFVRDTVNNKPKYISAGVVSFGDGCGKMYKPGIYTRNIYFLDWISENSKF